MHKHITTVNRKWLNKTFESASEQGTYFTGSTPREVAHSIVQTHDMHPAFVGKLDELITSLVKKGAYVISAGQLKRSDNIMHNLVIAGRRHSRIHESRRAKKQTRQHERDLHTSWQAEALA